MALARRRAIVLTFAIVLLIYSAVYLVGHSSLRLAHPEVVGAAALFDLTITTSAAFYFLLIRRGHASWFTLAALSAFSVRTSQFLVPALDMPSGLLRWMTAPVELLILAKLLTKLRNRTGGEDALARIRFSARAVIPQQRLADFVATEMAVLYYALFSWRSKPERKNNSVAFSYAEASGYSTLGLLLMLGIMCEGVPLHFVISQFSHSAAWIWTALDAYGMLWALAILRATRLRTILVNDEYLQLRVGFWSEAIIPVKNIISCHRISNVASLPPKFSGYWKTTVLADPQYLIELAQPATVIKLWGNQQQIARIGVAVDNGRDFAALLTRNAGLARLSLEDS